MHVFRMLICVYLRVFCLYKNKYKYKQAYPKNLSENKLRVICTCAYAYTHPLSKPETDDLIHLNLVVHMNAI
jgi:hypothetical protein